MFTKNKMESPINPLTQIHVAVNQLYFSETLTLKTILGSCVSVVIFCPGDKLFYSSMSHYLLPEIQKNDLNIENQDKYGDLLLIKQIHGMLERANYKTEFKAMVFGGANIKNQFKSPLIADIGKRNIDVAIDTLKIHKIEIVGRDIGGETGRFVEFNPLQKIASVRRLASNEVFSYR